MKTTRSATSTIRNRTVLNSGFGMLRFAQLIVKMNSWNSMLRKTLHEALILLPRHAYIHEIFQGKIIIALRKPIVASASD